MWGVTRPQRQACPSVAGQLQMNGGPATVSFVEQVELAGGMMLQHGQLVFNAASSGIVGGLYNGLPSIAIASPGFRFLPMASNSNIQALINGAARGRC